MIKNEDDEGWAVAMIKDGEPEPALVGPWTMGRDKKNPKPLDTNAFHTLVKTASEVLRRHEQQLHAQLHKSTVVSTEDGVIKVTLDIVPDDDHPYALLTAIDEMGERWPRNGARPASSCRRPAPRPGSKRATAPRAKPHFGTIGTPPRIGGDLASLFHPVLLVFPECIIKGNIDGKPS